MVEKLEAPPARPDRGHLPGDVNMWVFVLGDLVIFAVYFIIFMIYRTHERDLYLAAQQQLSLTTGAVNTLVLLASSRFVAVGVTAARAGDHPRAVRQIGWGGACGILFVLIKAHEWITEIQQGNTLPHNGFFMFYYLITGVHLVHVLLGFGILAVVLRELRGTVRRRAWVVEAGGIYWHMVDLLWVVIFALLYVMR